jgi:hypothetical protein
MVPTTRIIALIVIDLCRIEQDHDVVRQKTNSIDAELFF